jgi:tripartite-type tricarboxylate transporter receptor subunit TctC
MRRRHALLAAFAAAAIAFPFADAARAAYPDHPIRLVVGVPAGGTTDLVARVVGEQMSRALGQPIVVENRGGAGGNIAAEMVAKAAPDGYTLFLAPIGTVAINPSLYDHIGFDPIRDFAPISQLTSLPMVMLVHPSVPAKNVKEFIAYAKAHPDSVTFASGGAGTSTHLAGELFKMKTGIHMTHVPYKGNSPAMADLLAGRVTVMFDQVATGLPQVRSGKLRALGVTTAQRSTVAPDIPTLAESGLAGFDVATWHGLVAPAATPGDVVATLNAAVHKALESSELREKFKASGIDPIATSPQQFGDFLKAELARWRDVVKASGAKVN